jgi:hypothetical protein
MLAGLLAGGALGGVTGRGIGSAIGKGADKNSNEEMKGMTAKQKLAHNRIKAAIAGGTIGGTWVTPIVGAPVGALIGRARYDAHREESSKKR